MQGSIRNATQPIIKHWLEQFSKAPGYGDTVNIDICLVGFWGAWFRVPPYQGFGYSDLGFGFKVLGLGDYALGETPMGLGFWDFAV